MPLDRAIFFAAVRDSHVCGPTLSQTEVDGLTALLDGEEALGWPADLRWVAYDLATAWHESLLDLTIEEIGRGRGKKYGKPDPRTGKTYYGRGPCQLTWYDNYEQFGRLLGLDLLNRPELACVPASGAQILIRGSRDGLFRVGRRLGRYFSATADDPVGARDIINGDVEKNGRRIAGYYLTFLKCLRGAWRAEPAAAVVHVDVPLPGGGAAPVVVASHEPAAAERVKKLLDWANRPASQKET